MLDRKSVDQRLREIEDAIQTIASRLDALEGRARSGPAPMMPPEVLAAPAAPLAGTARGVLGVSGRTFIVLGGAFLLRALTESGTLPPSLGAWLGLAYAAAWLAAADRTRGMSALFHGLAALMVALPLIAESAARFRFFSPIEGTVALGAIAALSLGVAWHRRMRALAAIALAGALVTAIVVAIGTGQFVQSAALVIAVGLATLWIGYESGWPWLAWPAAIVANMLVVALAARAAAEPPRDSAASALTLLVVLVVAYLGSFALRNLFHERSIRTFEVVQTAAVLVIGFAGAIVVARAHGYQLAFIAVPSVAAGLVTYVQAFARVLPRRGRGRTLTYYLSLSFALTVVGATLLIDAGSRPALMAGAALAATVAGWRLAMPLLSFHGAVAAVIAAAQSGLFTFATLVWLRPASAWPDVTVAALIVFVTVGVCYALPRAAARDAADDLLIVCARAPLGATMVWAAGALLVAMIAAPLGDHPGWLATLKTVILAAAGVALALARRSTRLVELGWLTYPVLLIGLAKLFVEDLAVSEPRMLVIAFVAYGVALTAASRVIAVRRP